MSSVSEDPRQRRLAELIERADRLFPIVIRQIGAGRRRTPAIEKLFETMHERNAILEDTLIGRRLAPETKPVSVEEYIRKLAKTG